MNLAFLPEAVEDIDRLYAFIAQTNPLAARKAMLAIDEGATLLQENPYLGIEMEHDANFRQLYVPFGKSAYVLRYRIHAERDALVVVRVWHGREARRDR